MFLDLNKAIVLESKRVRLEPLTEDHFEDLLPLALRYPDLLKYSPSRFGREEDLKEYIRKAVVQCQEGERYPFAIFDKKSGRYAGSTSYMNIYPYHKRLEIGSTWIGKEFQRTGLNRACKYLLLNHVFESLEYERLELKTDRRNEQSRTAILGIGATFEGCLRSHTLMTDGYRRDSVYYSILRSEWPNIRDTIFAREHQIDEI